MARHFKSAHASARYNVETGAQLGSGVGNHWRVGLVSMETKGKLVAVQSLLPLHESGARAPLDGHRKDAGRCPAGVRGRFESAFSNAPIGMALIDMDGRWLQVNSALCRITGHTESSLKETTLQALTHPDDVDLDMELRQQLIDGEISSYQVEKRCLHAWGHFVWMMMTASLVRDKQGHAFYLITQFQDISERKELAGRLEYLVDHDFLTGMFNRRHFERELAHEVERSARYGSPGSVLLIDVDHFKMINDTFGHMAGDDLLKGIAGLLKHRMRHTDTLARLGGDEFAVLLPQTNAQQASAVAADFVKALNRQAAVLADQSIHITASIGVASFENLSDVEVLKCADIAMYGAKQAGRNRFVLYQPFPGSQDRNTSRRSEADRIRQAVEQDRFLLYGQPILDLLTNEVHQYELLLRLPELEGSEPLLPNSFLYVAERFGLIFAVDNWVIRKAIALIAAYARAGQKLTLNVNLSGKSIGDPRMVGFVEDALAEEGIDPAGLVFEVTEAAAIANLQQARACADRLRSFGCGLALDNFGAGLASFYYLKNFPFDYLKIDGEFIRGLSTNPVDQLVVRSIVCIAQGMGKKTFAVHVADADAVCLLRNIGVDYAQGYHIGSPRPVAEILPIIDRMFAYQRTAPPPAEDLYPL
jgi:diguanylate cyclase (GGDEF)-like protein/PAS domain S-box-containing protein